MIRSLVLAGLWLGSTLSGNGAGAPAIRSVPLCAGVTLSASYLASVDGDQEPGFRFTVSNATGHEIRLVEPVPSSAHWYARSNGRWLWRASNGSGGGLVDAGNEHGRVMVYPAAATASRGGLMIVPARQSRAWTASQKDNPVLAYNPSCMKCSYPGEREYEVIFAYAYLDGSGGVPGLLPCGLRSLPVPMPPKS